MKKDLEIKVTRTLNPSTPPKSNLGFGKFFTDHFFSMEYSDGEWKNPEIKPYAPLVLDPCCAIFHYGQAVFEGLKAYKNPEGEIRLFRPQENIKRLNVSSARLCIPALDEGLVLEAIKRLVKIDERFIPEGEGTALYIRPSVIATDASLGVHASKNYLFFIIMSPVGAYYEKGFAPIKLNVEKHYVRSVRGGTGETKVIGNYAASLLAAENAKKAGCDQCLWLDAKENRYVEEVGSMNIFFVFGKYVITPKLSGSILPGITRKSVIEHLKAKGFEVKEDMIDINNVLASVKDGSLTEIFGTGTAAVISPVGSLISDGVNYTVASGGVGMVTKMLYDDLTGIQTGKITDPYNWIVKI